jgi:hypothetical protein
VRRAGRGGSQSIAPVILTGMEASMGCHRGRTYMKTFFFPSLKPGRARATAPVAGCDMVGYVCIGCRGGIARLHITDPEWSCSKPKFWCHWCTGAVIRWAGLFMARRTWAAPYYVSSLKLAPPVLSCTMMSSRFFSETNTRSIAYEYGRDRRLWCGPQLKLKSLCQVDLRGD